ncbi:MAG: DUF5606 domain-containing protein [Bacteroidetes bacterium]|nr:DUF5606 domain-containing protein [Bacteroidota bacterium]MCL1968326.1 DUF5606 domain-containing protein [Bacteroidota bacterium]
MDLSKILSISGKNGLFKLISQGKNNFIVESLEDQKRFSAFQSDGVSTLDNISIYTHDEMLELKKVFQAIYVKQDKQPLEYKAWTDVQMRDFFKEVVPNYDEERVFISNIRKSFQWYNILLKNDLISIDETETEEPTEPEVNSEPNEE